VYKKAVEGCIKPYQEQVDKDTAQYNEALEEKRRLQETRLSLESELRKIKRQQKQNSVFVPVIEEKLQKSTEARDKALAMFKEGSYHLT
jgi:hypothetical protein